MKNFRKVLALILVVATLFSFVAMASAKTADEYSDYADVKYVEAVDVLTAIGIINGYDGAFHPADTIDRDEMAKMIAVLRNAGDFDADLYAAANKFADVKGQWAEGYVAYCAQLGIIAGYNATTFAPDAAVKVIEVAKMLLCTLGFDAEKQGYVGANWQVAVLRDATKYGLIPEGVDPYAAATRDQAAQMFLNALQCDLVAGYVSDSIVYITNSLYAGKEVTVNGDTVTTDDYHWTNISLKEAEKAGWEIAYGNAVVSTTPLYSIYKNLDVRTAYDCYDRPGHEWYLKGVKETVIGFYADAPIATWTDADAATVRAAREKISATGLPAYVDGAYAASGVYGNGVLIELYADRVVFINTYIAKVANVSKYYGTFQLVDDAYATAPAAEKDLHVIGTFKTGDYAVKNGDVVLYWICDGTNPVHAAPNSSKGINLHDLKVIEAVNVDVTAGDNYYNFSDDVLYTADKSYKYAANLGYNLDSTGAMDNLFAADIAANGKNYNLYLDEYGYIMYYAVPAAADTTKYAYVVEGTGFCTGNQGQIVGSVGGWDDAGCADTATLVHFAEDGALEPEKKFAVDHDLLEALAVRSEWDYTAWNENKGVGMLVRYTVDEYGDMVYTDGVNYANQGKYAPVGATLNKGSYVIDEGIYCTSKTKFMIRTKGLDGKYTYEQVTGYENLKGSYVADEVNFKYATNKTATNIQYFTDKTYTEFATYVFIDAKYQTAEAEHFLVLGEVNYQRFETALDSIFGKDYFVYDAIVDGERALVASRFSVAPGFMYDDILSYLGFNVTLSDGTTYELYVWADLADDVNTISAVDYTYKVVDGEVYVAYTQAGVNKMAKLADGAKVFTLKAVYDATAKKTVMKVEESIVTAQELLAAPEAVRDQILRGYIYLTDAIPAVADEIYIVTDSFYDFFN